MEESVGKPKSQNQLIAEEYFDTVTKGVNTVNCRKCGKEVKQFSLQTTKLKLLNHSKKPSQLLFH